MVNNTTASCSTRSSRDAIYPVNRFASIFTEDRGTTWHVYNDVTGHPVYRNPSADAPDYQVYDSYASARTAAREIGERYRRLERGIR